MSATLEGDRQREVSEDVRSRDAVETAIDRSKEPLKTWESALPGRKDRGWSTPSTDTQTGTRSTKR